MIPTQSVTAVATSSLVNVTSPSSSSSPFMSSGSPASRRTGLDTKILTWKAGNVKYAIFWGQGNKYRQRVAHHSKGAHADMRHGAQEGVHQNRGKGCTGCLSSMSTWFVYITSIYLCKFQQQAPLQLTFHMPCPSEMLALDLRIKIKELSYLRNMHNSHSEARDEIVGQVFPPLEMLF